MSDPAFQTALKKIIGPESAGERAAAESAKPLWLDALSDPVAGLNAYTRCVNTCNLLGDGEWRLVVADTDKKLKVWKGTSKESEHALLDVPVAICSFVPEATQPRRPSLAVASGSHVYIYRNLRPYYKFALPTEEVNQQEQDIWQHMADDNIGPGEAVMALSNLQESGVVLSGKSLQLMAISDGDAKASFIEAQKGQPLVQSTVISCMTTINQSLDEPEAVSSLVLGTESGRLLILNTAGTAVLHNIVLGHPPAMLAAQGELDVGYRITVAGRDGKLYNIKNGAVTETIIQLEAHPVGLARVGKSIMVGCMNDVIHSYKSSGQKNFTLYLPASILAMQLLAVQSARMTKCLLVALANGELRIYNEKHLVSTTTYPSPLTAVWFGKYGREDNTLVTISKTGALDIKMLPRKAELEGSNVPPGPPPEQDIPLAVPKKTKLYVEQTQREREQATDMHRIFQRDLAKLRLATARAYVKVLTDGQGAAAFTSNANIHLNLTAHGLGPRFKLIISVRNDGAKLMRDTLVAIKYDAMLYQLDKRQFVMPLLVPSVAYQYEVDVLCLDPNIGADTITVIITSKSGPLPILQAQLRMPLSELEDFQ